MAIEKCNEFNNNCNIENCIGVLVMSFSKVYELALSEENTVSGKSEKQITRTNAAQDRFQSKLTAIQNRQPNVWRRIQQISAPSSPVDVHRLNSVKAGENERTLKSIRGYINQPDIHAVCNSISNSANVTNYTKALGSNKFVGENLLQIINYTTPDEYASSQIINKIYSMECATQLHQVDLINQVIGRNLGFREAHGGLEHHLIVSYGLWDELWPTLMEYSRYGFTAVADAKKRRDTSHNRNKSTMNRLIKTRDEEDAYSEEIRVSRYTRIDQVLDVMVEAGGYYDDAEEWNASQNTFVS
ncbi:MAG: hypothetical protein GQ535_04720 [Rhodobacteraceae bacterium]|nr:hypothetical protein [Paracoccaceae bacterium]